MRRTRLRSVAFLVALALGLRGGLLAAQEERTLFVLLDAVPFGVVANLTDPGLGEEALFKEFHPPVPLISTFPSSTSVAAGGILQPFGMQRSPGYEARFFDWEAREVRGGGLFSYFKIEFPWREFFDWSRKGVARSAFAALWPVRASIARLDQAVEVFFTREERNFFVYIETTDTAAHLQGPESLAPIFRSLDAALSAARRRHPDEAYRVVLFSDHGIAGGVRLTNAHDPAERALRGAGFEVRDKLVGARNVALTPFGLVSSFEAYTRPENAEEVARVLAAVEGVDFCVHAEPKGWVIESRRGRAVVRSSAGLWSYSSDGGDPLDLGGVVARLADASAEVGEEERGAFPDHAWLEATGDHEYPDALYRLARAFDLVENPASVLCSLEHGYMYGLGSTAVGARIATGPLRYTHGALFREASLGFVMSDDPSWSAERPVRFNEALVPFMDEQ